MVDNGGKRDPVMHEILADPDAINLMVGRERGSDQVPARADRQA